MISLLVSDLQENSVEIPTVYSRSSVPISIANIANHSKQEDVNLWPYLTGVTMHTAHRSRD